MTLPTFMCKIGICMCVCPGANLFMSFSFYSLIYSLASVVFFSRIRVEMYINFLLFFFVFFVYKYVPTFLFLSACCMRCALLSLPLSLSLVLSNSFTLLLLLFLLLLCFVLRCVYFIFFDCWFYYCTLNCYSSLSLFCLLLFFSVLNGVWHCNMAKLSS